MLAAHRIWFGFQTQVVVEAAAPSFWLSTSMELERLLLELFFFASSPYDLSANVSITMQASPAFLVCLVLDPGSFQAVDQEA